MPEKKKEAPVVSEAAPIPAIDETNVNPLTGEIDDLGDLRVEDEPSINSIRFATAEEIKAMPTVWADVIHDVLVSKDSGVARDSYYVRLNFDDMTNFRIPLTSAEYGILATLAKKKKASPQYKTKFPCRIIGTQWEDGNISYSLEVVLCDRIRKTFQFKSNDDFIGLVLMRLEQNMLTAFKPIIRQAPKKE